MSSIKASQSLTGAISARANLSATIMLPSAQPTAEVYTGTYQVKPQAFEDTVLQTADKHLTQNITVTAVPYFEVSNLSDGKTVYIASNV